MSAATYPCLYCGQSLRECNERRDNGPDSCCMRCDGAGRGTAHYPLQPAVTWREWVGLFVLIGTALWLTAWVLGVLL